MVTPASFVIHQYLNTGDQMSVGITVFDGADCIGGNKIYLEFRGGRLDKKGIFFDFGTNFKKNGEYYEEFLTPRTGRGIHDLLSLNIIPRISCYRPDLITSDVSLDGGRTLSPLAVFVSHAHLDHTGNIGLLDRTIPVVTTPMTTAIMKAMQDCSSRMESEVAYISTRIPDDEDGRLIEMGHYKKFPYQGRNFFLTGPCHAGLPDEGMDPIASFWCFQPTSKKLEAGTISPASALSDLEFRACEVDHSMYGASAFAVNTDAGWIVYSGDLRLHGTYRDKTVRFVETVRELAPRLLIIEGTRASRTNREESEREVYRNCLGAVENEPRLVIADFSARNFERLDLFRDIAAITGRTLVVLMKDAYLLRAMHCVEGIDRLNGVEIYRDLKAARDGYEKTILTEYAYRLIDPREIRKNPEQYILCFSFFDIKHLLDIKTEGGTYIYSSSEAFTEEQRIDFQRLWNWLTHFRFTVRGFSVTSAAGNPRITFEPGYHASGHASGQDLLGMIRRIDPEMVMPVHTERPAFFAENLPEFRVILPENGQEIIIDA
jgi:ribonuclease J